MSFVFFQQISSQFYLLSFIIRVKKGSGQSIFIEPSGSLSREVGKMEVRIHELAKEKLDQLDLTDYYLKVYHGGFG